MLHTFRTHFIPPPIQVQSIHRMKSFSINKAAFFLLAVLFASVARSVAFVVRLCLLGCFVAALL
jgi:hypothetical protein